MFRGMLLRRSLLKVGVMALALLLVSAAAVLSRSSGRALAATQAPVAEYSFDEGEEAGATVEDLSEEGNDATLEGAKRTTHGRYGGALELSGEETCATVPTSGSLQLDEEFTLEAWVRPSGTPTADPIFFKESEGTYSYAMSVGFGNEGQPEGRADGEQVLDPHTIEPGVWTHIAFTYDGRRCGSTSTANWWNQNTSANCISRAKARSTSAATHLPGATTSAAGSTRPASTNAPLAPPK
jgi:Concanavalin A-like lectin/glucanases superfamily